MNAIFGLQHWIYGSAIHALQGLHTAGLAGVPPLIAAAFAFGMLHALLPGHGKSVLASYYAGDGRLARGNWLKQSADPHSCGLGRPDGAQRAS